MKPHLLLAGILAACISVTAADKPRPNFVIFYCDDAGYGDFGCYGATDIPTPNIDRLAKEGLRFTSFYVAQAVCSASRTALLTGSFPNRIGIFGALNPRSNNGIAGGEVLISELLKPLGYSTGIFGKWHLGHHREFLPLQNGFDEYLGLPYSNDMWPVDYDGHPAEGALKANYPKLHIIDGNEQTDLIGTLDDQATLTRRYTERAVKFVDAHKAAPFFLYVPYAMPHVPLGLSERFRGTTKRGPYGDVIAEIDWSVGEVMNALRKAGVDENTFVIFSSDNGPWLRFGNHAGSAGPLREGKGTMFEGGCRVPGIFRWPGHIKAGRTSDAIAATVDVLPTIAEITGAKLPEHKLDGVSQLPLLLDENAKAPRDTYTYFYGDDLIAQRRGPWKLFFPFTASQYQEGNPTGKDRHPAPAVSKKFTSPMLFNLADDIGERNDLAAAKPELVAELTKLGRDYEAQLKANRRPAGQHKD
jgi:arylsulfatase A-like enzyme